MEQNPNYRLKNIPTDIRKYLLRMQAAKRVKYPRYSLERIIYQIIREHMEKEVAPETDLRTNDIDTD